MDIRDEIAKENHSFYRSGRTRITEFEKRHVEKILALVQKEIEKAIPKECHATYHIEKDVKYIDENYPALVRWEEGHNNCLSKLCTNLQKSGLLAKGEK